MSFDTSRYPRGLLSLFLKLIPVTYKGHSVAVMSVVKAAESSAQCLSVVRVQAERRQLSDCERAQWRAVLSLMERQDGEPNTGPRRDQ